MGQVGLPKPAMTWIGYLVPELEVPLVLVLAHRNPRPPGA